MAEDPPPARAAGARPGAGAAAGRAAEVLIVGIGNDLAGDDAAGLVLARELSARVDPRELAVRAHAGEPLALLDGLAGFRAAVIVDASHSGAAPGSTRRIDVSERPVPSPLAGTTSTHAVGLGEALELARVLGRLPDRVVLHTIEGRCFQASSSLSEPVRSALPGLCEAVLAEGLRLARARGVSG